MASQAVIVLGISSINAFACLCSDFNAGNPPGGGKRDFQGQCQLATATRFCASCNNFPISVQRKVKAMLPIRLADPAPVIAFNMAYVRGGLVFSIGEVCQRIPIFHQTCVLWQSRGGIYSPPVSTPVECFFAITECTNHQRGALNDSCNFELKPPQPKYFDSRNQLWRGP